MVIIRVKNLIKNLSSKNMRDVLSLVVETLTKIENKFPPVDRRLIEIET